MNVPQAQQQAAATRFWLLLVCLLISLSSAFHPLSTSRLAPHRGQQLSSGSFVLSSSRRQASRAENNSTNDDKEEGDDVLPRRQQTRREVFRRIPSSVAAGAAAVAATTLSNRPSRSYAADGETTTAASVQPQQQSPYQPARRPTAYRVDSTIPPTLVPLATATKQKQILLDLGHGSGTDKNAIVIDTVNLNNVLNKAVFGTIGAVSSVIGLGNSKEGVDKNGPGYASFVCLGVPTQTSDADIDLACTLLAGITQARKTSFSTALGLAFCPYGCQGVLNSYAKGDSSEDDLVAELVKTGGVPETTVQLYLPLIRKAKSNGLDLLALSPELDDLKTVRSQGLQYIDTQRREQYVVDPEGFIELSKDPKFKLYADRSLLKGDGSLGRGDSSGSFFAERILVHEAAATAASRYAASRPGSLVVLAAPAPDLRFLGGINARIPRLYAYANKDGNSKVTDNAVTTILLNPTAEETLSKTRRLRLEIGTGPDTLQYQTKIADYLWFSSSPKVNLIPRLMEG